LENSYRAAAGFLERVLGAEIYPVRKEIDESLRDRIERYLWGSLYVKPELQWMERYRKP